MFPVEAFENTIGKFVAIAEAIGLPFHIIGGSISSAYGEPRLTQDIDIVVSIDVARIRTDEPTFAASFGVARKPSKQTFEPKLKRFG